MIFPRTVNQRTYNLHLINPQVPVVVGAGPAGTGKTLFACHVGVQKLRDAEVDRLVITRPAVSVDEQHGFLPGGIESKMDPWVRPMFDILGKYYTQKKIHDMLYDRVIEICPLAYMRGRTFDNAWIMADEMQNSTPNQMQMVLTRIGAGSKVVITGDTRQHDTGFENNGLSDLILRVPDAEELMKIVKFDQSDVQRNEVIKKILSMYGSA
jgi:phosphate starvation-inducible protein PhoH and related proteins